MVAVPAMAVVELAGDLDVTLVHELETALIGSKAHLQIRPQRSQRKAPLLEAHKGGVVGAAAGHAALGDALVLPRLHPRGMHGIHQLAGVQPIIPCFFQGLHATDRQAIHHKTRLSCLLSVAVLRLGLSK